jgi:hypothetical protein
VGGYAVEWLRSCYQSEWRLYRNSALAVKGRYVFRPASTPHYPGLHNLGSRNWTTDERDPWPALGETEFAPRPYDKGAIRAGNPPAILLGTGDCIANGETLPLPVFVPPRTFPGGFDSRIYTASGLPVPLDIVAADTGGTKDGGSSVNAPPVSSRPTGGSRTGGHAIGIPSGVAAVAIGGSKEGGHALSLPSALPATGGSRSGGYSINQPQGAAGTAVGGMKEGRDATSSHSP